MTAKRGDSTVCVHGARATRRGAGQPVVGALVRSVNYELDDRAYRLRAAGAGDQARVYGRETNPTLDAVEARIAELEGAERALLFASGMAALHAALLALLEHGDNLVAFRQLYGGSTELFGALLPRLGATLRTVDVNDVTALRAAVDERTRIVYCESISNPLTAVADLPAIADALGDGAERPLLVVDATLATPVVQRPLALGADLVLHSATKYLGGHSDLVGGVLVGSEQLLHRAWSWRTRAGGCMDPTAAFLLERGLKTLALRMRAHADGALQLAGFLEEHPRVPLVNYCGLASHPHHALARRLLASAGGLLSFVVEGGDEAAFATLRRLELFTEAASLGSVESLATRPRDMSHAVLGEEGRRAAGIDPGLLRLSVGIEDPADLVADLAQALA